MAQTASPITPPEWMNASYFESILRKSEHDPDLTVSDVEITPIGQPGEYVASQPFRATFHYVSSTKPDKQIKLVVKTLPEKGIISEGSMPEVLFQKEIEMYGKYLPKMKRVLDDGERSILLPRYLHGSDKPHKVIVLEDVAPGGWKGHDLIESYEEVKPITIAIARFHAASFYLSKNKTDFGSFQTDVFKRNDPVIQWMYSNNLRPFVKALRTWKGVEHIADPLERTLDDCHERLHNIYCCDTPGRVYNVLNHGDFHSKNLLHLFNDEGAIVDSRFLDFQVCCWSSPAIDLYYLLNNIVHYKVKANHKDEIIAFYHKEFTSALKAIGYLGSIPTMVDLQTELLRNAYLDLLLVTCFLQFRFVDFSNIPPEQMTSGKIGHPGLENEEYQAIVKEVLPEFLRKGIIE